MHGDSLLTHTPGPRGTQLASFSRPFLSPATWHTSHRTGRSPPTHGNTPLSLPPPLGTCPHFPAYQSLKRAATLMKTNTSCLPRPHPPAPPTHPNTP
jgi:hypothetical protein